MNENIINQNQAVTTFPTTPLTNPLPPEPPPESPQSASATYPTQTPPPLTPNFETPTPLPEEKSYSKIILVGIIILATAILSAIGFFLIKNQRTPQTTASIIQPPHCQQVITYDQNWNLLNVSQLSQLQTGDIIRLAVQGEAESGSFDKARFKINGIQTQETTNKKPGTEEFYIEYTIPEQITQFQISAEIHHQKVGWTH